MSTVQQQSINPPFGYHPSHKVLRYLDLRDIHISRNTPIGSAIILDAGTTGLSHQYDYVTELGWIEIAYDQWHQICGLQGPYVHKGIFPNNISLVSDCGQQVSGIDPDLQTFLDRVTYCGLIISHNCQFDRPMLEKAIPALTSTNANWACSLKDLDWRSVGSMDNRLCDLLDHYGACHNRHDTEEDVIALTWLLGRFWPEPQINPFPYPKLSITGHNGPDQQRQITNLSMLIREAEARAQEQLLPQSKTPSFGVMDF